MIKSYDFNTDIITLLIAAHLYLRFDDFVSYFIVLDAYYDITNRPSHKPVPPNDNEGSSSSSSLISDRLSILHLMPLSHINE